MNTISSLSFTRTACSIHLNQILIYCIWQNDKICMFSRVKWAEKKVIFYRFKYLLAKEWATSASSSRLFLIFLPLERSGTLTESIFYLNEFSIYSSTTRNIGVGVTMYFTVSNFDLFETSLYNGLLIEIVYFQRIFFICIHNQYIVSVFPLNIWANN